MRRLKDSHPLAAAVWCLEAMAIAMFSTDPMTVIILLLGAALFAFLQDAKKTVRYLPAVFSLFLIMTAANPLLNHRGNTVLFVMNDSPVTLEALIYGAYAAAMIVSVFFIAFGMTEVMTSEKILHLLRKLSPKASMVLSMSLRSIPHFAEQAKEIEDTQKTLGLYKKDNIVDTVRGKLKVFDILTSWALENGITTAESMEARGWGSGKRSYLSPFKMTAGDAFLLLVSSFSFAVAMWGVITVKTSFYPVFSFYEGTAARTVGYLSAAALSFLPSAIEIKEVIRWKYLTSKI